MAIFGFVSNIPLSFAILTEINGKKPGAAFWQVLSGVCQ
jgi:hypothetical protein